MSWDEINHANRRWTKNQIDGMVRGISVVYDPYTGEKQGVDADGYLGNKCKAYDTGDPELILDAIQLEEAVASIEDLPVRAATLLRMFGWNEADIGSVIRDRQGRPGSKLVDSGIRAAARHERLKRSNTTGLR